MGNVSLFLFNSLSVTFGFLLFTFILYIFYRIFYNDSDENDLKLESSNENSLDLMDDLESIVDEEEKMD